MNITAASDVIYVTAPTKFALFLTFLFPSWVKLGTGNESRTILGYYEFRENRWSEVHTLLRRVKEFLSCCPHLLRNLDKI